MGRLMSDIHFIWQLANWPDHPEHCGHFTDFVEYFQHLMDLTFSVGAGGSHPKHSSSAAKSLLDWSTTLLSWLWLRIPLKYIASRLLSGAVSKTCFIFSPLMNTYIYNYVVSIKVYLISSCYYYLYISYIIHNTLYINYFSFNRFYYTHLANNICARLIFIKHRVNIVIKILIKLKLLIAKN